MVHLVGRGKYIFLWPPLKLLTLCSDFLVVHGLHKLRQVP